MKILVALTYYHPHWTGLTAYAQRLAEGLAARGHSVTVLTSRFSRQLPAAERHNGVDIVRLPTIARISRGVLMPSFPAVLRRLLPDHDVVQFHTPMLEAPLVTALARAARRRVLMTHHGDLVMPSGLGNQLVQHVVTGLMGRAAAAADRVSVHSADYAVHSSFLRPSRASHVYIHPPVCLPSPDVAAAQRWKSELGLAGRKIVGFAGRFVEEKGFDILFRAIAEIRRALPEAAFVFAGDCNVVYEDFYQRSRHLLREPEAVTFLGLQRDPARLAQFYSFCDAVTLPSRSDCFPSVQIEALLSGTPVIVSDIPGAREPVQLTGMGLLVPPEDPHELAAGIVRVLTAPERFRRSPAEIRATFDSERAIADYERLLASLCPQSPPTQ